MIWTKAPWGHVPCWSSGVYYFCLYLGKIPILTNIFQVGWNHQLAVDAHDGSMGIFDVFLHPGLREHPKLSSILSMRLVYFLPTWKVGLYGKCTYIYTYQSHGSYGMVHKSPSSHFCGCLFETLGNIWNKLPTANGAGFLPSRVVKFFFSPKTNMSSVKIVLGRRPFPVEMAEMAPFVEETVSFHGCILICRDFVWFCLELPSLSWLRWSWFSEGYDGWIFSLEYLGWVKRD